MDGEKGGGDVRTVSGESSGRTRVPSNRKRTVDICFPWRSQKASISFLSCVVRLILKKTSLLLSVTLMFRCSVAGAAPSLSDMMNNCCSLDFVKRLLRMGHGMATRQNAYNGRSEFRNLFKRGFELCLKSSKMVRPQFRCFLGGAHLDYEVLT